MSFERLYSRWYKRQGDLVCGPGIAVERNVGSLTEYLPEDWGNNVLDLWAGPRETFCELKKV